MLLQFAPYLLCVPRLCGTPPKSCFFLGISCCALSPAPFLDAHGGLLHFLLSKWVLISLV